MIFFPNAKINLGLHVIEKRADGYHNLETVMYPVSGLCDVLEVLRNEEDGIDFSSSGIPVDCPAEKNICVQACRMIRDRYGIGGVKMHLHKRIPFGAGLGGGSADAVFVLKALNELFALSLTVETLEALAAELGSDTVFFVRNQPALATGRGECLSPIRVGLEGLYLMIVKPPFSVSTAEAYRGVRPHPPLQSLETVIDRDPKSWRKELRNDFEPSVFALYPELGTLKQLLYDQGALYAAMSGSGSALFGLFQHAPSGLSLPARYWSYTGKML